MNCFSWYNFVTEKGQLLKFVVELTLEKGNEMISQAGCFFFFWTLDHFILFYLKMRYSCSHYGWDWLRQNLPYSVHVWLAVWTWGTKEYAAHEGIHRTYRSVVASIKTLVNDWNAKSQKLLYFGLNTVYFVIFCFTSFSDRNNLKLNND